jgi:hypothetical protein
MRLGGDGRHYVINRDERLAWKRLARGLVRPDRIARNRREHGSARAVARRKQKYQIAKIRNSELWLLSDSVTRSQLQYLFTSRVQLPGEGGSHLGSASAGGVASYAGCWANKHPWKSEDPDL